jgi:hypothetical protein
VQSLDATLAEICALGNDWHGAGTVSNEALRAMSERSPRPLARSAETGTGRSTVLLSNLSQSHVVFTKDDRGDGDSLDRVRSSPLFVSTAVDFVIGRTQLTIPSYRFQEALDLVFIDGPHGFPFPVLEYYYLYPHVRPGGLLIVDDIQIPSIRFMFRFLSGDDMWRLDEVVGNTAFFSRTNAPTFDPLGDGWWLQGYNKSVLRGTWLARLRSHAPAPLKSAWRAIRGTTPRKK